MRKLIMVLYIVLTGIAASAAGIPEEIDADTAKSMLDADKKAKVSKCKEVEVDEGKVVTVSGDDLFSKATLKGTKKKALIRRGVKSGKRFFSCTRQRLNEVTDNLANARGAKAQFIEVN